jgi:hypothetical protein
MKIISALHHVSIVLMTGGIAGVGLAATVLFQKASSREVAGQIGNVIFGRLAPSVMVLSAVILATAIPIYRSQSISWNRTLSLGLAVAIFLMAAVVTFWLTPRMGAIWNSATHAGDGSGLTGEPYKQFMMMHGISNLVYIGVLLSGLVMTVLAAVRGHD